MEFEIGIGKTARRAYGFDEVAIVPSRRTRDPEDVNISWEIDAYTFALPMMASAMDAAVSPTTAIQIGQLGGLAVPEPRGPLDPLRGPGADLRGDRLASRREGHPAHAGALRRAGQARADRQADRGDQGGGRGLVRLAHARAGRAVRLAGPGGRARHPGDPGHGRLGGARLQPRRAAQPEGVHPQLRHPRHRRRVRVLLHGPAPDAHGRRRCAGRRRPRERMHHAWRARGRRAPGNRDRRCCGRAPRAPARDRPLLPCDRRRRHAHGRRHRQGDRVRRRRGDDRLADDRARTRRRAAATTGGWRRSTRRCLAGRGSRPSRSPRSRRSWSVPPTRTTARSTCSARWPRRWPPPGTRRSRSSRRPSS